MNYSGYTWLVLFDLARDSASTSLAKYKQNPRLTKRIMNVYT